MVRQICIFLSKDLAQGVAKVNQFPLQCLDKSFVLCGSSKFPRSSSPIIFQIQFSVIKQEWDFWGLYNYKEKNDMFLF